MKRHRNHSLKGTAGYIITAGLFFVILIVMLSGTFNLRSGANAEGVAATRQAIERAAVLCYATEGFYPPSLSYIEDHYGVQVDRERYAVRYEVFAPGVTPSITVVIR